MTSRLLPRAEYHRLTGTLLEDAWPQLPDEARVVVVEDGDRIVACSALFPQWHQEGTEIAESHRGSPAVGRLLLKAMREQIAEVGAEVVCMLATTPETSALCQKFGTSVKLDAEHFLVRVA